MRLSPRQLPDVVTHKTVTTTVNDFGEAVKSVTESQVPASVQPVEIEDLETIGGEVVSERRVIFLRAGVDVSAEDRFSLDDGADFHVTDFRRWPGSHTRVLVVRAD